MADLVITLASVANVNPGENEESRFLAGEALVQGELVYLNPASLRWRKAINTAANSAAATGIVLDEAPAAGQPVVVQTGGFIIIGATLTKAETYITSANAGKIAPIGDLASGQFLHFVAYAQSATVLGLIFTPTATSKP